MFPLDFPLKHLEGIAPGEWVLDPFCGRGTTAFAARIRGINSVGLDVNPVAVAIAKAKLVTTNSRSIVKMAESALGGRTSDRRPEGEFWDLAFHKNTLAQVLKLRAQLRNARGPTADALRGLLLGALHGPQSKTKDSYLSNQMQRTFAPKPDYAVRYWKRHRLKPRDVDVLSLIRERAERYYRELPEATEARVLNCDAKKMAIRGIRFSAVITSPPYFGMASYVPDQWLRNWFLGGQSSPLYGAGKQLAQGDWVEFANSMATVWRKCANRAKPGAKLVIRFGALPSRQHDPETLIRFSLADRDIPWRIKSVRRAGDASAGHRQGIQMGRSVRGSQAVEELDISCQLM
jgi:hypothetical protein